MPAAGHAQRAGESQQELSDPSIPTEEGREEEAPVHREWPGGWRAAQKSGARPQGESTTV